MATIIFLSEVNWGYLKQRHHFFSEEYAKKNKVIYVGKIGLRYPKIKDITNLIFHKSKNVKTQYNEENIIIFNKRFLPPINFIFRIYNKYFIIPKLNSFIESNNIIIHYYQPTNLVIDIHKYLLKHDKSTKLLYDCVQDYRFHPAKTKKLISYENHLLKLSDLIICDSIINYDRLKEKPIKKLLVPPGVELQNFSIDKSQKNSSDKTRILYYGNIRKDLNIKIINKLAENSNFEITLVGFLNLNKKHLNSNVKVLNAIPYNQLKSLIIKFDALLLPYDVNNIFTEAIIPAKFFECLATGLPIISTEMKSTSKYHHLLNLVNENSDFTNFKIRNVTKEELLNRKEIINTSSWESRFNSFYEKIKY